jgi:hypothetical protein
MSSVATAVLAVSAAVRASATGGGCRELLRWRSLMNCVGGCCNDELAASTLERCCSTAGSRLGGSTGGVRRGGGQEQAARAAGGPDEARDGGRLRLRARRHVRALPIDGDGARCVNVSRQLFGVVCPRGPHPCTLVLTRRSEPAGSIVAAAAAPLERSTSARSRAGSATSGGGLERGVSDASVRSTVSKTYGTGSGLT